MKHISSMIKIKRFQISLIFFLNVQVEPFIFLMLLERQVITNTTTQQNESNENLCKKRMDSNNST